MILLPLNMPVALVRKCRVLLTVRPAGFVARMPPLVSCTSPKPSWLVAPEPMELAVTPSQPCVCKMPVKVLAPVRNHVPPSDLVTVRMPPLSVRLELIVLASLLVPRRVSVLPTATAFCKLVKTNGPLPLASMAVLTLGMIRRAAVSPAPT